MSGAVARLKSQVIDPDRRSGQIQALRVTIRLWGLLHGDRRWVQRNDARLEGPASDIVLGWM